MLPPASVCPTTTSITATQMPGCSRIRAIDSDQTGSNLPVVFLLAWLHSLGQELDSGHGDALIMPIQVQQSVSVTERGRNSHVFQSLISMTLIQAMSAATHRFVGATQDDGKLTPAATG